METWQEKRKIEDLVDLFGNRLMVANPEYQRGEVWSETQQKKLIDSVMRGYTLPLIYLHEKKEEIADIPVHRFEIIDGQQRLTAIHKFKEGSYRLFDPNTDNHIAKFPLFVQQQPCEWAGKYFHELSEELQTFFLDTSLMLTMIKSEDNNEIRDLFIRLQAGSDLNPQERRDAWPGGMCDFILRLGGKPDIDRYPGHEYFREIMGLRPGRDRGKTRQLAAQITSLLIAQPSEIGPVFPDINAAAIDQLYYENLNFNPDGRVAKRIWKVLDTLLNLLRDGKRPNLRNHDTIHAALLVNMLLDDFTPSWQADFTSALDSFLEDFKEASEYYTDETRPKYPYWSQYGVFTRTGSDKGPRIFQRHAFYVEKMLNNMPSITLKDPKREYSQAERELIYFRQKKMCAVCDTEVIWADVEIHHVVEHQQGGKTELKNAALVHASCHPKSADAVSAFANKWATHTSVK